MKKVFAVLFALITLATSAVAEQYTLAGTVISVGDVVAVEATDGNIWEFVDEGWNIGETCVMVMSDNFTPRDKSDDEIIVHGHYMGK